MPRRALPSAARRTHVVAATLGYARPARVGPDSGSGSPWRSSRSELCRGGFLAAPRLLLSRAGVAEIVDVVRVLDEAVVDVVADLPAGGADEVDALDRLVDALAVQDATAQLLDADAEELLVLPLDLPPPRLVLRELFLVVAGLVVLTLEEEALAAALGRRLVALTRARHASRSFVSAGSFAVAAGLLAEPVEAARAEARELDDARLCPTAGARTGLPDIGALLCGLGSLLGHTSLCKGSRARSGQWALLQRTSRRFTGTVLPCQGRRVALRGCRPHGSVPRFSMRVHLHPQRRTVDIDGRRRVGQLLAELGVLPGTAMVIRGDLLLTDAEMVEDTEEIEIRAVISGGSGA